MSTPISVTIFTGSPGTDGSRVFEQVLKDSDGLRLTAIVPKRGRKRKRTSKGASLVPTTPRLVRLGEGCACCTVRGDLMSKVRRIAEEDSADHVVIQTTPGGDLSTVAKTFTVADGSGAVLSDVARIQSLITVIDTSNFTANINASSARHLIERIELANVIVLEGTGVLTSDEQDQVRSAIEALNPDISITNSDDGDLTITSLQSEEPFDLNDAQDRSIRYAMDSESDSSNSIVRFDYQDRRPFHPTRLNSFLEKEWPGLLRIKGSFWVASQPKLSGNIDVAGGSRNTSCNGMWWASIPKDQQPDTPEFHEYIKVIWHSEFGDRHQDLSIVGIGIEEEEIRAYLNQCQLTDEELAATDKWASMPDPFHWPELK